jgi:hypothetical protein
MARQDRLQKGLPLSKARQSYAAPSSSAIDQTWSVNPASIAGVTRGSAAFFICEVHYRREDGMEISSSMARKVNSIDSAFAKPLDG